MDEVQLSRRERKKQKTKESILKSARALFEKNGIDNTTIHDITERSDLSKATFFNYFPSKESLLSGIAEDEVEDLLYLYYEEIDETVLCLEKIRIIMKQLLTDSIPFLRLTGLMMITPIVNIRERPSPFNKVTRLLNEIVLKGQEDGEISSQYSSDDIVSIILGGYYSIIFRWFEADCTPGEWAELERILDIQFTLFRC